MLDYNSKIIGSLIKEFRLKKGYSLEELSLKIGCSTGFLKRIENEETVFSDRHLKDFIKFLEIPKEEINKVELLKYKQKAERISQIMEDRAA